MPSPARTLPRRLTPRSVYGRLGAWVAARATSRDTALTCVIILALVHAALWTMTLTRLKAAQDLHFDTTEAYAWGQTLLLGYGKHPPLSGWIAGAWFAVFPATDWAAHALAMTTVSLGLIACWLVARRVVDRRRAFVVAAMLAIYPVFNFKGFKFNADLPLLLTLPLLVLAYLHAFGTRSVWSGVWLGLAATAAVLTKYWALTLLGAIGIAALLHPARLAFLRSPAPWVALAVFVLSIAPHAVWLVRSDFAPLRLAGSTYAVSDRGEALHLALGYIAHNALLLLAPILALALAVALGWAAPARGRWLPRPFLWRPWSMHAAAGSDRDQRINIWIVQAIVALGPPLGAVAFSIFLKSDWGIALFFPVPLALLAMPALQIRLRAAFYIAGMWLALSCAALALAPRIALHDLAGDADRAGSHALRSGLARELTQAWRQRFNSPWPIVAGTTEISTMMTFYSADHPAPLVWNATWPQPVSWDDAGRSGYVAVCDSTDWRFETCRQWLGTLGGERISISTRRFFHGVATPAVVFQVAIVAPKA